VDVKELLTRNVSDKEEFIAGYQPETGTIATAWMPVPQNSNPNTLQ
jgi:hypothetical protein